MAFNIWRCLLNDFCTQKHNFVRQAHKVRGKPPGIAKTLQQRLEILNARDEVYTTRIDIGLPPARYKRSEQFFQRLEHLKKQRSDKSLEKLARSHQLLLDLQEVNRDWLKHDGPHHIRKIAEHYGIFEHLYKEGYFIPRVNLNILYEFEDFMCPVYYGNIVKPIEAKNPPEVLFNSDKDALWTLMLINLDGHFTENNKEYIHWCVTNIPGNAVENGDTIVQYLQPIPPKGTGYHRYVFVLYKQEGKIDFKMNIGDPYCLAERTFYTRDWYKQHQDNITPAGLAFFQSIWDPSLQEFFHNVLKMREPVFEYDFPQHYINKQVWFPLKHPFNLYLDKYRDQKQIAKEYFLLKLKKEHPFKTPEPPLKYPNAQPLPRTMPSWLKVHERKIRLGWGRINDV